MKGRTSEGPRKTHWALLQATEVDEGEPGGQKLPVRTQGTRAELSLTPFYLLPLVGSVHTHILVGAGFVAPTGFLKSSCKEVCADLPAELCASQDSPLSEPALVPRETALMSYLLLETVPDAASGGGKAALGWDKAGIQVLQGALVFEQ